jgi:hypothetical protein
MTRIQVLLFAVFVLAPVFGVLMRAVGRRLKGEAPRDLGPAAPSIPVRLRTQPPTTTGARPGPRGRARGIVASGMVVTSVAAGSRPPSRLGSRREVRRGIVLMTVLGPCRALEVPGD